MSEKKYYAIDRIEENTAICECDDGSYIEVEFSKLYPNAKEQDIFFFENGEYYFDKDETQKRREENISLLKDILADKE